MSTCQSGDWAISSITLSTCLVYNKTRWPGDNNPKTWADFSDVKKFPWPRSLQRRVYPNLEYALMADGIPADPKKLLSAIFLLPYDPDASSTEIPVSHHRGHGGTSGALASRRGSRLVAAEVHERGQHHQRGGQRHREPDHEQHAEAPDAPVVRNEQAAEAGHGRETVEHHTHDRAPGRSWTTLRRRPERPEHDVHAVLDGAPMMSGLATSPSMIDHGPLKAQALA